VSLAAAGKTLGYVSVLDKLGFTLSKFAGLQAQAVLKEVVAAMVADIRRELDVSYRASGVQAHSLAKEHIELYAATVTNSVIQATQEGFKIAMPPGLGKKVYIAASTFRYGGIRGTDMTHYGKKKLKKTIQGTGANMSGYIPPKPHFFQFDAGQLMNLQAKARQHFIAALRKRGIEVQS
jgi:hypothetical protein